MTPTAASFPQQSNKINGPFAPLTKVVQDVMKQLTPCAKSLWTWVRSEHRPFKIIEINIRDFSEEFDYTLHWTKKAYQELINCGLWEESYRWPGGRDYRGMIIDPGVCDPRVAKDRPAAEVKNFKNNVESFTSIEETFTTRASNPDAVYPITKDLKDLKETRTLPPPVLRQELDKEKNIELPGRPEVGGLQRPTKTEEFKDKFIPSATPELKAEPVNLNLFNPQAKVQDCPPEVAQTLVEKAYTELGVKITQPIYALMIGSTIQVVINAIDAVQERLSSSSAPPVRSKEGLFTAALQNAFKPNHRQRQNVPLPANSPTPGFSRWYDAAHKAGLVSGSQLIDGEIWLYLSPDLKRVRWTEFRALHPEIPFAPEKQTTPIVQAPTIKVSWSEPVDLTDVIEESRWEIRRLKWDSEQVISFLKEHFGKRDRMSLSDDELFEYVRLLKAL